MPTLLGMARTRKIGMTLATCAALALAVPAAVQAQTSVAGQLRVAVDSAANFSNMTLTAQRHSYVILQPWQTDRLAQIKAASPSTMVLMHKNLSGATDSQNAGYYSSGVSYQEADTAHPEWFLKDASGSRINFMGFSWLYAMDVGNAAYQQAWANNVVNELVKNGWDGVFMDNTDTTMRSDFPEYPAKYQTDTQWQAATASALAYIGPRIQAAGKLAVPNIGGWGGNPSVGRSWLQYVSGAMDEMFLKWGTTAGTGYADAGRWANQLGSLEYAQQQGKDYLAVTHSSASDGAAARYGWATVLLGASGHAAYTMAPDYSTDTWFPEYDYAIGDPTGAESTDSNGVHRRVFQNGIVVVNPTAGTLNANLGGSYSGSGLTNVSSVSLAPHSAYVLTANATSPPPPPPPPPSTYTLTVSAAGNGSVTGTGISCPGDCSGTYASGTVVNLTATPASGSTFSGWGGSCSGSGACSVTMGAARSVSATFTTPTPPPPPPPPTYTLAVSVAGNGSVTGTGIGCPGDCSETYRSGTVVNLTATPAAGSTFSGWDGSCSGTGACSVTMSAASSVGASFTTIPTTTPPPKVNGHKKHNRSKTRLRKRKRALRS
jgi:hypothetical protein